MIPIITTLIPLNPEWVPVIAWLLFIGLAGFVLMGVDKSRAISGGWRYSEMSLFTIAFIGGFWGVIAGSNMFRHKTMKIEFMGVVYIATMVWIVILIQLYAFLGAPITS